MDIEHQRAPADEAGKPGKIENQRRQHQDAEEHCVGPMSRALHAVEPQNPGNGFWVRVHRDAHPAPPVNATSVGPVEPSRQPLSGYPFCSQYPGMTSSTTRMADSHLSDL